MLDDIQDKEIAKRVRELEWQVMQLSHDLIHDPLTGLKTRAYFEEQVGPYLRIIREAGSFGESQRKERFGFSTLSVIFFDIDRFKSVNDTYGHDTGDLVLQQVAHVIKTSVRTSDTVARWGGEEMVASLLGATEEDVVYKAEEIRKKVSELTFTHPSALKVTISSGVATFESDQDLASLVKRADQALYAAKETGRNKVVRYTELRSR